VFHTERSNAEATPVVDIVLTGQMWHDLRTHLLRPVQRLNGWGPDEQLAFLLASSNCSPQGRRLLVREMLAATPADLVYQGPAGIAPRSAFVLHALNRCRNESLHLVEVHSHPFSSGPGTTFSGIDWANDRGKMPGVAALVPHMFHTTMVVGRDSLDAHFYEQTSRQILPVSRLVVVGCRQDDTRDSGLHFLSTSSAERYTDAVAALNRYHRQTLFLGQKTQKHLADATVAIVGLGGIGSFVALELAHLGVGHLILVDPDIVEETNLNRLVGAGPADIGRSKVRVYEEALKRIAPALRVDALACALLDDAALDLVKGADILAGCVDNHGARMVLNQLAIRYLIPLVDGGSGLKQLTQDAPLMAGGQVQTVVPGLGCLECRGFIDMRRATFDLAPPKLREEEIAHGYGLQAPAPAVISLNGLIGSVLVNEIMLLLASDSAALARSRPPISVYSAFQRSLVAMEPHDFPACPTCGNDGVLGLGDLAPVRRATDLNGREIPTPTFPEHFGEAVPVIELQLSMGDAVLITGKQAPVEDVLQETREQVSRGEAVPTVGEQEVGEDAAQASREQAPVGDVLQETREQVSVGEAVPTVEEQAPVGEDAAQASREQAPVGDALQETREQVSVGEAVPTVEEQVSMGDAVQETKEQAVVRDVVQEIGEQTASEEVIEAPREQAPEGLASRKKQEASQHSSKTRRWAFLTGIRWRH